MTWQNEHNNRMSNFPGLSVKRIYILPNHRKEIEGREICGCFYCCSTFSPNKISDWVDENDEGIGQCALCPKCSIESVIGSMSGFSINETFLNEMKYYWL